MAHPTIFGNGNLSLYAIRNAIPEIEKYTLGRLNKHLFYDMVRGFKYLQELLASGKLENCRLITDWYRLYIKMKDMIHSNDGKLLHVYENTVPVVVSYVIGCLQHKPNDGITFHYDLLQNTYDLLLNISPRVTAKFASIENGIIACLWVPIGIVGDFNTQFMALRLLAMLLKCIDSDKQMAEMKRINYMEYKLIQSNFQKTILTGNHHPDMFENDARTLLNNFNMTLARPYGVFSLYCTQLRIGKTLEFYKLLTMNRFWIDFNYTPRTVTFQGRVKARNGKNFVSVAVILIIRKLTLKNNILLVDFKPPASISNHSETFDNLELEEKALLSLPKGEVVRLSNHPDVFEYFNGSDDVETSVDNQRPFLHSNTTNITDLVIQNDEATVNSINLPSEDEESVDPLFNNQQIERNCTKTIPKNPVTPLQLRPPHNNIKEAHETERNRKRKITQAKEGNLFPKSKSDDSSSQESYPEKEFIFAIPSLPSRQSKVGRNHTGIALEQNKSAVIETPGKSSVNETPRNDHSNPSTKCDPNSTVNNQSQSLSSSSLPVTKQVNKVNPLRFDLDEQSIVYPTQLIIQSTNNLTYNVDDQQPSLPTISSANVLNNQVSKKEVKKKDDHRTSMNVRKRSQLNSGISDIFEFNDRGENEVLPGRSYRNYRTRQPNSNSSAEKGQLKKKRRKDVTLAKSKNQQTKQTKNIHSQFDILKGDKLQNTRRISCDQNAILISDDSSINSNDEEDAAKFDLQNVRQNNRISNSTFTLQDFPTRCSEIWGENSYDTSNQLVPDRENISPPIGTTSMFTQQQQENICDVIVCNERMISEKENIPPPSMIVHTAVEEATIQKTSMSTQQSNEDVSNTINYTEVVLPENEHIPSPSDSMVVYTHVEEVPIPIFDQNTAQKDQESTNVCNPLSSNSISTLSNESRTFSVLGQQSLSSRNAQSDGQPEIEMEPGQHIIVQSSSAPIYAIHTNNTTATITTACSTSCGVMSVTTRETCQITENIIIPAIQPNTQPPVTNICRDAEQSLCELNKLDNNASSTEGHSRLRRVLLNNTDSSAVHFDYMDMWNDRVKEIKDKYLNIYVERVGQLSSRLLEEAAIQKNSLAEMEKEIDRTFAKLNWQMQILQKQQTQFKRFRCNSDHLLNNVCSDALKEAIDQELESLIDTMRNISCNISANEWKTIVRKSTEEILKDLTTF